MIDEILKWAPAIHAFNMILVVISLIKIMALITRLDNSIYEFMKAHMRDKE